MGYSGEVCTTLTWPHPGYTGLIYVSSSNAGTLCHASVKKLKCEKNERKNSRH